MEPNRREFIKQCAFQKFCNTVLHNEACDAHKELHRHKAKEITFSDLTLEEARQLHTFDEYFKGETAFERAGKKITPKLLLEAIRTLPEEKRKAVLLYYFVAEGSDLIATVNYHSRHLISWRRHPPYPLGPCLCERVFLTRRIRSLKGHQSSRAGPQAAYAPRRRGKTHDGQHN